MRTNFDLDPDALLAVREVARQRGMTMGKVLSDLARQALTRQADATTIHGLPQFPIQPGAGVVTLDLINRLRDEMP